MQKTFHLANAIPAPQNAGEILLNIRIRMFSKFLEPKYLNGPMGMVESVNEAKKRGLSLVPYADFKHVHGAPAGNGYGRIRTGTLVIHEADGRTLGERVVSGGNFSSPECLSYEVPPQLRGKRGWLVAESPNFDFTETGEVVVPVERIIHVERAATHGGTFRKDQETGVPVGDRIGKNNDRKLDTVSVNNKHEPCIDLIVRDMGSGTIYLDVGTSEKLKALVRPSITPENYVEHVVSRLQEVECSLDLRRFVYDWMSGDRALSEAVNRSRLLSIFAGV